MQKLGRAADGRAALIEGCTDWNFVRYAIFDDVGLTYSRVDLNRHGLSFILMRGYGLNPDSVTWTAPKPASRDGNPFKSLGNRDLMPEWRFGAPLDGGK